MSGTRSVIDGGKIQIAAVKKENTIRDGKLLGR